MFDAKIEVGGLDVTVMGLGRFGGGVGVARWLASRGADVLVTDTASPETLHASREALADLVQAGRVRCRFGPHETRDFTSCDLVVANPAVPQPWENEFLRAAESAGVPITTEIRLLVERLRRDRVIGVTGSAGKSTTAAMIRHVLDDAGHPVRLGGNIGGSLLADADAIGDDEWIVLELSSAMLHWLDAGVGTPDASGFSPGVAVLTNIEPNHLDWHGTFEHYVAAKERLFAFQTPGDHQVRGDALGPAPSGFALAVPGAHNRQNAIVAAAAVERAVGMPAAGALPRLAGFTGLPHRLELVAGCDGRRFYNDSKSTTPGATILAVDAFDASSRVHLIAGGYDKAIDLTPIVDLAPRLAGLYGIGVTGRDLTTRAASSAHAEYCETLDAAVRHAFTRMDEDDVLLLSPGCASWDQFDNFERRGERFREEVERRIRAAAGSSRP